MEPSVAYSVDRPALVAQLAVLGVLAVVYLGLAAFWVPPHNRLLLPIGGLAMAACGAIAWWLGPARSVGREPLAVWLTVTMLLLLPAVAGPQWPRGRGFVTASLGIFCALGAWAVFRYPALQAPRVPRSIARDLRWGVAWGAGSAAALSLLALVGAVVAGLSNDTIPIGWILASYWTGGLAAGAIAGLCRPLGRWPLGSMVAGIPATGAVYGAVLAGLAMAGEMGPEAQSLGLWMGMMVVFCTCFGPAAGLFFRGGT